MVLFPQTDTWNNHKKRYSQDDKAMNTEEMLKHVDHTLLLQGATWAEIKKICEDAVKYHTASVCIPASYVKQAKEYMGDRMNICTVIGFPLGATSAEVKAFETRNALDNGATEIDMVINIGALKAGENALVARDIRGVVEVAHAAMALVKVIIETSLLTDEEKVIACLLAKESGADYVKTSTGFSGGGATVHDIALMRRAVGPGLGVKASGGIHTHEEAEALVAAGATRIGASAGVKIIRADQAANPAPQSKAY